MTGGPASWARVASGQEAAPLPAKICLGFRLERLFTFNASRGPYCKSPEDIFGLDFVELIVLRRSYGDRRRQHNSSCCCEDDEEVLKKTTRPAAHRNFSCAEKHRAAPLVDCATPRTSRFCLSRKSSDADKH
jgi:hypothetical protein